MMLILQELLKYLYWLLCIPGIKVSISNFCCLLVLVLGVCILVLKGKIKIPINWLRVICFYGMITLPFVVLGLYQILKLKLID